MAIIKARILVTMEFGGPPGKASVAARKASKLLGELINQKCQDPKGELFLTVKKVTQMSHLVKRSILEQEKQHG